MEDHLLTEIPLVTRTGINQVFWAPVRQAPRAPRSEAVPFHMQIALMAGGMRYPAGEYRVKVTKGDRVYEKVIQVFDNPDEPYTSEDRKARRELQQRGFELMEDLAYVDRRINETRTALEGLLEAGGLSSSLQKKAGELETALEEVRERLLVTQYGDLRGDARLREELGFLYGTISFYGGRPTQVQQDRMDLLETRVRAMEAEVSELTENRLSAINKGLTRAGREAIVLTSREAFDAEE